MTAVATTRFPTSPLRFRFREVDDRAGGRATQLPLLSVSVEKGVVLRNLDDGGQAPSEDVSHYKVCSTDDVAINKLRAFQGGLGVAPQTGMISPAYAVLRFDGRSHPRYIHYLMRSHWFVGQMTARVRGVGGVDVHNARTPHINVSDIGLIEAPEPPLDTQRRIANALDAETARIDTLIEKNERASELAQLKLREAISSAVTRGIDGGGERAVDAAWAVAINDAWSWAPYQYYAELGTGHTPSRSDPSLWENCNVPWVTTADVKHLRSHRREYLDETEHHLSERGLANSAARWLPARTVVLSRTASVGFSAVVTVPTATSQDFFTWTCDEERLLPEYLLYVLRAMKFRGHFDRLMYGSTHKTIYFPDLVQLRGPLPPVPEQRKIVDYVREQGVGVQSLLERMSRMNELLRLRRQSLITAAVTGQIEV